MSDLCIFGGFRFRTSQKNVPVLEANLYEKIAQQSMDFGGKRMLTSIKNRARGVSRRMLRKDNLKRASQHLLGTSRERFRTPQGVPWDAPGALLGGSGACWQRPGASRSIVGAPQIIWGALRRPPNQFWLDFC